MNMYIQYTLYACEKAVFLYCWYDLQYTNPCQATVVAWQLFCLSILESALALHLLYT